MAKKYTKSEIEGMIKNLKEKEKKARSKWGKAVLQDAQWLLENVIDGYDEPYELSEKLVLNGASDWGQFSWGGSGLIYDAEIAEHYCTPSELKKVGFNKKNMYVEKQPNANEEWLDVQARALRQAWWAIRDEMNGTTEFSMSLCNFSYQDVEGHYAGTENFKVIENNKDRLVLETDTMRSVWTFDGNNVVKYETTDKTSGKKIESKDSTSYFKKSQGLTEEYKGNEKIATFKTPKRTYTYDFKVGKLIDEKGNPANAKDMGKLLSNESSEVCDNIRKSVNQIEDELKKYGHLKMAKKDEVFATIKDSLAKTNFEINEERYDYKEAVKDDVLDYINENFEEGEITEENRDEIEQQLYDNLFVSDSVTGNASGSYTFDAWEAESYLCHNLDLLMEAMEEFGSQPNDFKGAEWGDVTIRCYLLRGAISKALDEYLEKEDDDDEDSNLSVYELSAQHDARKSFYGKAQVNVDDKTGVQTLYSYGTKIAQYNPKTKKFTAFPEAKYSNTTKRHVREFMKQNGVPASEFSIIDDTKDVLKATGKLAGNIVKNTTDKGGLLMF